MSAASSSTARQAGRPTRLAFVTHEFPTELSFAGGPGQELLRIALEMSARGCEIHVFVVSRIDSSTFDHRGLTVHRVETGSFHRSFRRWTRKRIPLSQGVRWLEASFHLYRRLRRLHRHRPFDAAIYANTYAVGLFPSLLLRLPAVTWIGSFRPIQHEVVEIPYTADSRMVQGLEALQYRLSRRVWSPSRDTQRRMVAAGFERVDVVPKPIYLEVPELDASVYQTLSQRPYLLFFGRYQEVKGFQFLAEALPTALPAMGDCSVALVGKDMAWRHGPSLREHMISCNREWADRLVFLPPLQHEQLYPVIDGARIVAMPSLTENMPNACLEAMALGTPVIATLGTSFEELIVDGETGFLVEPGDSQALAAKIVEAWKSPRLAEIGAAARESVGRFRPEVTVPEMLRRLRELPGNPENRSFPAGTSSPTS